ncbi:hypothetical protein GCM10027429_35070 [Marivirga atlantica]|uniref:DEAD/DEAH box helicase family protein n=1 Tax=Marivirga atlantica TaxID=1548457 RepID=A0A937AJ24_9BACT|nr:DEAD/DEAH box helicase family protein [Marivirga atlantica]MBL0767093.1 DEAD/DEAH box helicase family protein [Marivirga atlantica]
MKLTFIKILMPEIIIPRLERVIYNKPGNKNIIKQFLAPEQKTNFNIVESDRNTVTIRVGDKSILLTSNRNQLSDKKFILLINRKPTREILNSEDFIIRGWLKHPLLINHSTSQVIGSWKNDFQFKEEDATSNTNGLRTPQMGALYNIMGHLKMPLESGIVVLPTGTGKTETMLSALVANHCEKLLVAVPSDALRNQISGKFLSLGLLKDFGVVGEKSLYPIVGIIKQRFSTLNEVNDFFEQCNVVVTTMNILTSLPEDQQNAISDVCTHFFIDEAHHVKAKTWDGFAQCFDARKIIQYTATPFRNDGKRIEGKMIFNFPLKEAQDQGYFQKIEFLPIREYNPKKSDGIIAETAINKLREDLKNGFNHILMARCANKERARAVYKLYEAEGDLNPTLLYSGVKDFKKNYAQIIEKKSRIIICVDMLGEGFDLPELKIAAFHDIRKSLPITLQFAGRFTRTKFDEELGNACFIANIANVEVKDELEDLYSRDADWNRLLSDISHAKIEEEGDYKNLLQGFTKLADSNIPFQNIKPKLSTVAYKNNTTTWNPRNYEKGISDLKDCEYKFFDINHDEKMFVLITAKRQELDWV